MTKDKKLLEAYGTNQPELKHNSDGVGYVDLNDVIDRINLSLKNDKVGLVLNISFPIHYTCDHCKECYKRKECYGLNGCFAYTSNQIKYSENLKFFIEHTVNEIVTALKKEIAKYPNYDFFRWFAIGDIFGEKMLSVMVELAKELPNMHFYAYTKKHHIVNNWIANNGKLPTNLNIMFSLWTNGDGTLETVNNPYDLPTTVFIPCGKENDLLTSEMFVCPCSDSSWLGHCADCSGCPTGQHKTIAFLEHSTSATKQRDKAIKAERKAIKANGGGYDEI